MYEKLKEYNWIGIWVDLSVIAFVILLIGGVVFGLLAANADYISMSSALCDMADALERYSGVEESGIIQFIAWLKLPLYGFVNLVITMVCATAYENIKEIKRTVCNK